MDADTKLFMACFQQISDDQNAVRNSSDDEEPVVVKKQKVSPAIKSDTLSNDEAVSISFAAYHQYIRRFNDGDLSYIHASTTYAKSVYAKAKELKAEYKDRFDVAAVIAALDAA
jgi:hypothetical protein